MGNTGGKMCVCKRAKTSKAKAKGDVCKGEGACGEGVCVVVCGVQWGGVVGWGGEGCVGV